MADSDEKAMALYHNSICTNAHSKQKFGEIDITNWVTHWMRPYWPLRINRQ